jgi:hypothetical protein
MNQYISSGIHWRRCALITNEKEIVRNLMENPASQHSFTVPWTATAGDVSLFYYNATLATWFFGLNLVRFANGSRNLKII